MRFSTFYDVKYRYLDGMLKMWYIFDRQVFLQFKSSISLKLRAADFSLPMRHESYISPFSWKSRP